MKSNVLSSVMLVGGALLLYCAIKNQDPRDVIRYALGNRGTTIRPLAATPGVAGSTLGKGLGDFVQKNPPNTLKPNSNQLPPGTPTVSV